MSYSIVQTTLEPPTVEQIADAFASLDRFARHDGQMAAKDAYGVLISGLPREEADALHKALADRGVDTRVVVDAGLGQLPPPLRVRRIAPADRVLTVFDALGRQTPVPWSTVRLFAVGQVPESDLRKGPDQLVLYDHGILTLPGDHESVGRMARYIDMVTADSPDHPLVRYQIDAAEFRYDYLGGRMFTDALDNFRLLVGDLSRSASAAGAILNRGAHDMLGPTDTALAYPTRHSYEEEIRWLLWRAAAMA